MKKPELLAPAGDWRMLRAAVKAGANAVFLGLDKLNMRAKAKNFTLENLPEVVEFCKSNNVDVHLTLNSIVFNNELEELEAVVAGAKKAGVDMIICWDMSAIDLCLKYDIPICISTQASISNIAAVNSFKRLGAKRVVLARECSLEMIKEIKQKTDVEIETFIHGAMCVAISGRCFMSHHAFGNSANRGDCIQPCRREYKIYDETDDVSFLIGEDYVMSPKDLCTIEFIDQLIEAGIDSFKIEGRKRSPEYILKVVSVYRRAIDLYFEGALTDEIKHLMFQELQKVYNRGFSGGFYFDKPSGDEYAIKYGSLATTRKVYVGKVLNYYKKTNIVHVKVESNSVSIGDSCYVIGNTTGVVEFKMDSLQIDGENVETAGKGNEITFECTETVRRNDQLYKVVAA